MLAVPVLGGLLALFLPSAKAGVVVAYATMLGSLILMAVDAHRHRQPPAGYVGRALFLWIAFYPAYMAERAKWGAPRRLLPASLVALFFTVSLLYRPLFAEKTRVLVRCKPAGKLVADGFACSIEHTAGVETAKVCWDLVMMCANGPGKSANACGQVAPHQTASVEVPYASMTGTEVCDKLTALDVKNVVVTED